MKTHIKRKHGMAGTLTYRSWKAMMSRCHGTPSRATVNYGDRGIQVCAEWMESPQAFLRDVGERPSALHSLDRIDVNKGYEPGNCRWATKKEQSQNRRDNRLLTAFGETAPMSAWAQRYGRSRNIIGQRLLRGWSAEKAISTPEISVTAPRGLRGAYKKRIQ